MVWLIGSRGMLGQEIASLFEKEHIPFVGTDKEVDILDPKALQEFYKAHPAIKYIINCAAYTAVDKAESEEELAYKINARGVKNIAQTAQKAGAVLIHISTDYVFDGTSSIPLTEDDPPAPVSAYGRTKLSGEQEVKKALKEYFIIRTAWLYGLYGSNFVYTMLKLMNSKDSIKVVSDQIGSPTNAADLAALIVHIIKTASTDYGVYHFSNEGQCSWYEFAKEIYALGKKYDLITSNCIIHPCGTDEYPTPAKRPAYSLFSKEKVKKNMGFTVPRWEDSLGKFLYEL